MFKMSDWWMLKFVRFLCVSTAFSHLVKKDGSSLGYSLLLDIIVLFLKSDTNSL